MKSAVVVAFAAAAALCAGSAQAGHVSWSVGISAPGVATVVSNEPWYPVEVAPVYAEPQPVYRSVPVAAYPGYAAYPERPQVVYRAVPVPYEAAPVFYPRAPVPVYGRGYGQGYGPVIYGPGYRHGHHHPRWADHRGWRD